MWPIARLRDSRRRRAGNAAAAFSVDAAVALLESRGVPEDAIRLGSIPQASYAFVRKMVRKHCPQRPLRVLHVGNFVGVSLAGLSSIVVSHDPDSVVVSIDPNLSHLGVDDSQSHVLALLDHFGLQDSNLVICGYSLDRSTNETQAGTFADHPAGEHTLGSLAALGAQFDLALIDGNHDGDYVRRELDALMPLLPEGALLILDDVANKHTDLPQLYAELLSGGHLPLRAVGNDKRLGILRRTAGGAPQVLGASASSPGSEGSPSA